MQVPDNLIPLIYLLAVSGVAALLHYVGVPAEMNGLIVGAGITRIKISSAKEVEK
jgi:hypothetical protein